MIKTLSLMTDVLPHRQVVAPIPARNTHKLSDLLHSEFFGMWRDREDITDSALFARQLREEACGRSSFKRYANDPKTCYNSK